jgi:hypothetical protein
MNQIRRLIVRCPQDVDGAKFMDSVKITELHQGIKPAVQMSFRLFFKENSGNLEVF